MAALPEGWTQHELNGEHFYYNRASNIVQQTPPAASSTSTEAAASSAASSSSFDEAPPSSPPPTPSAPPPMPVAAPPESAKEAEEELISVMDVHDKLSTTEWKLLAKIGSLEQDGLGLRLSILWQDQGWGNSKGRVQAVLLRDGKTLQKVDCFGVAPKTASSIDTTLLDIGLQQPVKGDSILFYYHVGGGGGHELHIHEFKVTAKGSAEAETSSTPLPSSAPTIPPLPTPLPMVTSEPLVSAVQIQPGVYMAPSPARVVATMAPTPPPWQNYRAPMPQASSLQMHQPFQQAPTQMAPAGMQAQAPTQASTLPAPVPQASLLSVTPPKMAKLQVFVPEPGLRPGQQLSFSTPVTNGRPGRRMAVTVQEPVQAGSLLTVEYPALPTPVPAPAPFQVDNTVGPGAGLPMLSVEMSLLEDRRAMQTGWWLYAIGWLCACCFPPCCIVPWAVAAGSYFCKPQSVRTRRQQHRRPAFVALWTLLGMMMVILPMVAYSAAEELVKDIDRAQPHEHRRPEPWQDLDLGTGGLVDEGDLLAPPALRGFKGGDDMEAVVTKPDDFIDVPAKVVTRGKRSTAKKPLPQQKVGGMIYQKAMAPEYDAKLLHQ